MLLYAWDALDELNDVQIDADAFNSPVDLLASLLVRRVERLLRTGLDRGYDKRTEELLGLRGRIDISQSVKSRTMRLGRLVCEFDELSYQTRHNQIIRTTLARLARLPQLTSSIAEDVCRLDRRLAHIDLINLSERTFDQVVLHRNTAQYRLPIHICKLLYKQLIPLSETGTYWFKEFTEAGLAALFEEFLRNFYKREQQRFAVVKRERFRWHAKSDSDLAIQYLPSMETDISLLSPTERLVVEAKFYEEPLRSKYADSKKTFLSGHLYQVSAYLANLSTSDTRVTRALLIYPQVKEQFDYQYCLLGYHVRVAAADLTLPAHVLKSRLLDLIEPTQESY